MPHHDPNPSEEKRADLRRAAPPSRRAAVLGWLAIRARCLIIKG